MSPGDHRHGRPEEPGPGGTSPPASGVAVGEICSRRFLTAPRRRRVTDVARPMGGRWVSCVIVTEEGRPAGIVTKQTLIEDVLARGLTGVEVTVGDVIHTPIVTIDAAADVREAARLMARKSIRHLAVTSEGRMVGVLSDYHVARSLPRLLAGETPEATPARGAP